jgi:pimeloyl-ACP methyl ester carboxylesterase
MPEIQFKDGAIAYDVVEPLAAWGSAGPDIIFVHGIGADRQIWADWRAELAGRLRTIAIELPGHGESFRPVGGFVWTIDDLAEMVHVVARDAGVSRFVLVGESVGGTISLVAATGRSEVLGVVTCSTAHVGGSLGHVAGWREEVAENGVAAWSLDMVDKRFSPGQTDDAHRNWFDETQRASDAETILALADILVGFDHTAKLDEIRCPVLLIHPDSSPFIPLSVAVTLKEGLPLGELMVIPGARHGIACSHGATCSEAAIAFMERHAIS